MLEGADGLFRTDGGDESCISDAVDLLDDMSASDIIFTDAIDVVTDGTLDDMSAIIESDTTTTEVITTGDARF